MKSLDRFIGAVVLVAVLIMVGCSDGRPASTGENDMRTVCLDGVTYYLFKEQAGYMGWGYMSVKLGTDSKVVLCDQ
jgi:hypothetical protein